MPRNPNKTPCGVPGCRAWAIRGSDPPRCSPHRHTRACPEPGEGVSPESGPSVGAPPDNQNRLVHGFYSNVLRPEESADLVAYAADTSLEGEIAMTRVALRRILGMLLTGVTAGPKPVPLDAQDYARFASLAFRGAGTISRLLRARKALTGEMDDVLSFLMKVSEDLDREEAAKREQAKAAKAPDPDIEPGEKRSRCPGTTGCSHPFYHSVWEVCGAWPVASSPAPIKE